MRRRQQETERENAPGCECLPDPHTLGTIQEAQKFDFQRIETHARAEVLRHQTLERIIEGKVIPKLLLAQRQSATKQATYSPQYEQDMADRIGEFADLVINRDMASSKSYFEARLADGASIEGLFRDLLSPTARRLGELWEEDINSFLDVTQGMAHIQQLIRTFAPGFHEEAGSPKQHRRALIMPLPGEQHTMGCSLVEEYFRREGWHVWGGLPDTIEEIVALVGNMFFDMLGFSVSSVPEPEKLAVVVRKVREAALNRDMAIMVGGLAFVRQPELARLVGADATAADGPQAILQVASLIGAPRLRP